MLENKGLEVIKVVGIGQGGVNAINRMIEDGIKGVEFIAMNTDAQALMVSDADVKLDIGRELTEGLGTGGDPELGRQTAETHADEIKDVLDGANMVFITTGEGGGTGTGGAPVVARIAKEIGALSVGVVTRPFEFEGRRKKEIASNGIENLIPEADTTIVIPNERLLEIADDISLMDAFKKADEVLSSGVQGVTEILINPGLLQIDFNDVKTVFKNAGTALMGIGSARGDGRTVAAVEEAIGSNLLEQPIDGAKGAIVNFQAGPDLSLKEFHDAALLIKNKLHPEAQLK
jgi:cell division protein FtsZ